MVYCPKKSGIISSSECLPCICSYRLCSQKDNTEDEPFSFKPIDLSFLTKKKEEKTTFDFSSLINISTSPTDNDDWELEEDRRQQDEWDREQEEWEEEQQRLRDEELQEQQDEWDRQQQEELDRQQEEQRRRDEEDRHRRLMDHAWMECDIKKGMAFGTSCVSHPLARLELLKMGYRP